MAVIVLVSYGVACLGVGMAFELAVRRRSREDRGWSLFSATSAFLLGLGLLGALWQSLGLVGGLRPVAVWLGLAASIAVGAIAARRRGSLPWRELGRPWQELRRLPLLWSVLAFTAAACLALFAVAAWFAPPQGDAEAFYMVLPKIVAASGHLVPQPNYFSFTQVGLVGEMHLAALMILGGPAVAKLFTWVVALAGVALVLSLCARSGAGARGLISAAVILVSSTTFTAHMWDGKVDLYGAVLGLAAYAWILSAEEDGATWKHLVAGLFVGFACVAKFSNLPVLGVGVVYLLLAAHRAQPAAQRDRRGRRALVLRSLLVAAGALGAALPHLAKNLVLFSEPLAPFLFFGSEADRWVDQTWYNAANTRHLLLTYPLALVFGQYPMQGGTLSPLLLAFIPIGVVARWAQRSEAVPVMLRRLAWACLLGVGTWMVTRPSVISPRYILATLLLGVPVGAWAVERIFSLAPSWRGLRAATLAALFAGALLPFVEAQRLSGVLLLARATDPCAGSTACPGLAVVNRKAAAGDRVLLLGYLGYALRADLLQCLGTSREDKALRELRAPRARWEWLRRQGFRFVIVQRDTHRTELPWLAGAELPEGLKVVQVYDDEHSVVFELVGVGAPLEAGLRCERARGATRWAPRAVEPSAPDRDMNREGRR